MTPTHLSHDVSTEELAKLLVAARRLCRELDAGPSIPGATTGVPPDAHERLQASVIRPLALLLGEAAVSLSDDATVEGASAEYAAANGASAAEPSDRRGIVKSEAADIALWDLARRATVLCTSSGCPAALFEAAAALGHLACEPNATVESDRPAPSGGPAQSDRRAGDRAAELRALLERCEPSIRLESNGPLLVINVEDVYDWLGRPLATRPLTALCRCGASARKPYCDGSHARGFDDAKDPSRVANRRDTYVGQQVTIFDNRGTCQHSGFCTDRLSNVFRRNREPFVAPSGGRMDEIVRAVRDCPSGALGYAIDGVEARADVDHHRTRRPAIEISKNGPYRIVGDVALIDANGEAVARNAGSSREHATLCRCGHAQNKPFCTGMHWTIDFRDPVEGGDATPTIFEWAGGLPALTRMTRLFYEKFVPADDVLAPVFAGMSADHPQRVAKWLAEVFCGPKFYSEAYGGYNRMISEHLGRCLTEEMRARWVALLLQSAREAGLPNDPEFRAAFASYVEWGSRLAVENSQSAARPPRNMPMPHWDWNTSAGPPGSRMSALAPANESKDQAPVLPEPGETVEFGKHIKALFRERDRASMKFAFDLASYADVSAHAAAILERVRNGTMPCDGAWPAERVDVFARWIDSGKGA